MKKFSELVLLKKEQALTTSLIVAEYFEKNHFDVLRAIENCLTTLREVNATSNDSNFAGVKINQSEIERVENPAPKMFQKSTYKDAKGESRPMYYLNRDGFMLLVMGFTGVKAMETKLVFIEAFNRMEELLLERQSPIWQEARQESKDATREMTDAIKNILIPLAIRQGMQPEKARHFYTNYNRLLNKLIGSSDRELLTSDNLFEMRKMSRIVAGLIAKHADADLDYHDIYQRCRVRLDEYSEFIF